MDTEQSPARSPTPLCLVFSFHSIHFYPVAVFEVQHVPLTRLLTRSCPSLVDETLYSADESTQKHSSRR